MLSKVLPKVLIATICVLQFNLILSADVDGFNIESTKEQMKKMNKTCVINDKKFVLASFMETSWYRAAHICRYNGMQLAVINSSEENNLIGKLIDESKLFGTVGIYGFWTSGNDLGSMNNWYWLSNGKPVKYTNWKIGEPNNLGNTNERCLNIQMKADNYKWNDAPCDHLFYFICEEKNPSLLTSILKL